MKKQLTTIALLLLSLAGSAQTQKGFHVIGSVGTTNVSRDQRLLITLSPEVGYFGKVLGVTAVYNNTVNLYKGSKVPHHNPKGQASSIGLKLHAKVAKIDAVNFFVTAEASKYIAKIDKKIDGEFEFRPGATAAVNIYKNIDARFSYNPYFYRQGGENKVKHGASFGLAKRF